MLAFLPAPQAVSGDWAAALVVFFALLIVHAVGDYGLQGDFLAKAKNRHADLSSLFGQQAVPRSLWANALAAHCFIHAGGVWLVTGSVALAALEFLIHGLIDFVKCEGRINFATDQALHQGCKLLYVAILFAGPAWVTWSPA